MPIVQGTLLVGGGTAPGPADAILVSPAARVTIDDKVIAPSPRKIDLAPDGTWSIDLPVLPEGWAWRFVEITPPSHTVRTVTLTGPGPLDYTNPAQVVDVAPADVPHYQVPAELEQLRVQVLTARDDTLEALEGVPATVAQAINNADIPGTVAGVVDPKVTAAQTAQQAAEQAKTAAEAARNETVVTVAGQSNWTGAVNVTQAQSRSTFLRRRLTGNVTLTLAAGEAGKAYSCTLEVAQDATGGRTITIVNTATAYGVAIALSTGPNQVDLVHLLWNGSSWKALLGAAQVAIPAGWVV